MFVLHEGKSKHLSPFKNRRIVTKAGSQQKIRGLTRKQAQAAPRVKQQAAIPRLPAFPKQQSLSSLSLSHNCTFSHSGPLSTTSFTLCALNPTWQD